MSSKKVADYYNNRIRRGIIGDSYTGNARFFRGHLLQHSSYFTKLFSRKYGCTPSEYRKMSGSSGAITI
ncbi:MAG: AraC family transcriptional regulator [Clostridia bacterium]|nr:AraC family transcriptional regulator [Clostridia bacterium]